MLETPIDTTEVAVLADDISDEALEAAAMFTLGGARSIGFFCTGLNECPA